LKRSARWSERREKWDIALAAGHLGATAICRQHLLSRPDLLPRLLELGGKVLACWCCDWPGHGEPKKACHAMLLARLADGKEGLARREERQARYTPLQGP
jgi:hypothetical protein